VAPTVGQFPVKGGGLNGSTQHPPEVQSAVDSMARFVPER
jgi:hypothetical protein